MHSYGADTSQSCLFMWEDLDPHPVRGSLGPPDSAPKQHLNQYIRFCTAHGRESYTLQWIVVSPQKLALSVKHLHPLLIHGSLGQPHGTSIGSVVFARLTHVTNRQTDQQTDLATAYVATGLYR